MSDLLPLISMSLIGGAAALIYWTIANSSAVPAEQFGVYELETERLNRLRQNSYAFLHFEKIVNELVRIGRRSRSEQQLSRLEHAVSLVKPSVPWRPLEFIACKQLEAALAGVIVAAIFIVPFGGFIAVTIGILTAWSYVYMSVNQVMSQALARINKIKRRLPFLVDLIALMLEAGSSFQEALRTALRENAKHEIGYELKTVVQQIDMGLPQRVALEQFRDRLDDTDVADLIAAINKGEELGTPLNVVMRKQADQMRLKRSQWGEKAAAEAQVNMSFPALLVMLACMLLILGPFLLPLIQTI